MSRLYKVLYSCLLWAILPTLLWVGQGLPVSAQSSVLDATPLALLQGSGRASPFDGQEVATWGLVTGVTSDGFYLQDPLGDGDPLTSDGIFVYTYDAPVVSVGQCLRVAGEITEYYAKSELNWLSDVTPSPACGSNRVTPVRLPIVRPGDDAAVLLEPLEGMVVRLDAMRAFVHGPTHLYTSGEQELAFLPLEWQRYFGSVHLFQEQAELSGLLFLSNRLGMALPNVQWGDRLQTGRDGLVGVLDYNFGKYQLLPLPEQTLTVTSTVQVQPALPPLPAAEYGICSFNLHGFGKGTAQFPNAAGYAVALQQRAQLIASQLTGCTVIALQETGSPADAQALAASLTNDFGLGYVALSLAGPASYEAEFPLTNSMLVDAERVRVKAVESITGCEAQDYGIVAADVCPAGQYPVFDRPPLSAQLEIGGAPDTPWPQPVTVWVIGNHWKSKSGDESANARLRLAQATTVAQTVQQIRSVDAAAQVVVLGDLNDYYGGAASVALQETTGMLDAYDWLPPLQRYSYLYNGAAQVLDHLLLTPDLAPQVALVQILHLNADLPTGDSALTHSDHDPIVLRLRPQGAGVISGTLPWAGITVTASDNRGVVAQSTSDAHGDFRLWGLPVGTVMVQYSAPAWIVLDESMQLAPVTAGVVEPEVPHGRHQTAITGAWLALQTPWLAKALQP